MGGRILPVVLLRVKVAPQALREKISGRQSCAAVMLITALYLRNYSIKTRDFYEKFFQYSLFCPHYFVLRFVLIVKCSVYSA
jgi:hypothetical protein